MRLKLVRVIKTPKNTLGKLYIDYGNGQGLQYFCDTLEDTERDVKIYGETAIPKGVYRCINTYSNRFKSIMPLLQNVKGFTGVRIHAGNTESDTLGCILVGKILGSKIIESTVAYNRLWSVLKLQKNGYDLEII